MQRCHTNLKILNCKHGNQYLAKVREGTNGVRVAEDITNEELDGEKVVRVEAGSREFIGKRMDRCEMSVLCPLLLLN